MTVLTTIINYFKEFRKFSTIIMVSPFTLTNESLKKYHSDIPAFTAKKTKKNVVYINNFRGNPKYNKDYIDAEHARLTKEVNLLLRDKIPNVTLEELYHTVENLIQLDQRQNLISGLMLLFENFLREKLVELLLVHGQLFKNLIDLWKYYCNKVIIVKNVYLCYDRSSKNDFKFNTIQTMCLKLFKDIIVLDPVVSSQISTQLLQELSAERQGLVADREEIKTILSILTDLDVYTELFQNKFLEDTVMYFQGKGNLILNEEMDVQSYLSHVSSQIKQEKSRSYLSEETVTKVLQILYREMLEAYTEDILKKGFEELLDKDLIDDIILLFNLFSKVSKGIPLLSDHFEKYVEARCFSIVSKATDKNMIQELIDLKDRLDNIINECFAKTKIFNKIIKTIFGKKINLKNNQSAQYVAKYLDGKLRSKYISEDELEATLDKVMIIFRYIHGKDVFEAFYRKDLAKRLIFEKSTNQDVERSIIVKLKEECGEGFTAKLEGMLRDINLSRAINSNFKENLIQTHQDLLEKSDVSITVLTSSYWTSTITNLDIILPDELLNYQAIFRKYYVFIHSGRKLDWQPNLGHCVVRAIFGNTVKEIQVSLFQTIVLLLFNENDRLTAGEIQEMTKLEPKELIITMHSLACGKTRILLKEPPDNTVTMEDVFQFNEKFTYKLFRIKINQAQLKESADEQKATEENVLADRQFQIDAAIVRILKNRKVISHNELLAELFNILDIPVRPQDLKKRIELLIDREYIKRESGNAASYTYVA